MSGVFRDPAWRHVASSVLQRALGLRRGRSVLIETWKHTLDLADTLAVESRRHGIRPTVLYNPERSIGEAAHGFRATDAHAIARGEIAASSACDGYVLLPPSLDDVRARERLPPAHRRALERRDIEWNRVLMRHAVPSVWLLAASATRDSARQFGVDIRGWRQEAFGGSTLDPRWIRRRARPLSRALTSGRELVVAHPNGTHLALRLRGRRPVLQDGTVDARDLAEGRIWTTLPSGWLSVAVDERFAEGEVVATRPSRHRRGLIGGIRWTFRNGRLTEHSVATGRGLYEQSYRMGGRGRDRPGYVSIGLNPKIHDFPLAEDQAFGLVTVYVGHNDDYGGRTRGVYREYALIENADVSVDGRPLLRRGRPA